MPRRSSSAAAGSSPRSWRDGIAGGGPWFCPRCGGKVARIEPSIDPRFPLGHCKKNGKVPVIGDAHEAARLAEDYLAETERRRGG